MRELVDLPDLPRESAIRVGADGDGVTFSWPGSRKVSLAPAFIMAAGSPAVAVGGVLLVLLYSRISGHEHFGTIVALILTGPSILFALLAIGRLGSLRRQVMTLGPDAMVFEPEHGMVLTLGPDDLIRMSDRGPIYGLASAMGGAAEIWGLRPRKQVWRSAVRDVHTEGRGKFGHVVVGYGKRRLDVAKGLPSDDRGWLVEVLKRWRDS
ncbi:MAG: hypothetical protein ACYTKD_21285 [Planctomycetota bacterium]